jgi:hypothetical protein
MATHAARTLSGGVRGYLFGSGSPAPANTTATGLDQGEGPRRDVERLALTLEAAKEGPPSMTWSLPSERLCISPPLFRRRLAASSLYPLALRASMH